jgi:hypothetical protein
MTIFQCEQMFSELPLKADMRRLRRHVRNVPTTEVAFSLDLLVGEREKRRRDREAERRSPGSPHGLAPGMVRGFQPKNVIRPMVWGKLAISFWCDGWSASGSTDGARLT